MTKVLIVEDEEPLRRALARNLAARGYDVAEAPDATTALAELMRELPQVVVLDLGLPDLDGTHVIRAIRQHGDLPIVVLSARTGSSDKVEALDLGADDYITKPFDIEELLARLRAATRRTSTDTRSPVGFGDVVVNIGDRSVTREGQPVHLTPNEWSLLLPLVERPGRLVTGRELLTSMRGQAEYSDPSYLRIYIAKLRRKLEIDPARPRHLLTEAGMGYRLVP